MILCADAASESLRRVEDTNRSVVHLNRLSALNAKRVEEERAAAEREEAAKSTKAKGGRKKKGGEVGQGELGIG